MAESDGQSGGASRVDRDQERFLLRKPTEIAAVLLQLARRPEIITGYFDSGRRHLMTAVLGVDAESQSLILDMGPDAAINQAALRANRIVCVAKHQSVSVKFACGPLEVIDREDGPAFRTPLPDSLYRLQRREYFRVPTPVTNPVICRVPDPADLGALHEFRAVDLSIGGVGLVDLDMTLKLAARDRMDDAILLLPGAEEMRLELEVRNISRHMQRDGRIGRRLGMAFVRLANRHANIIQRYLHQLQLIQRDTRPDSD
ncbi:c-di-GMP-binding flagellar brake protein YcgR [Natronocella acetinitrilica]|jgi:flagellar brake protein|uniref:Flagellar brake protein YcgR n=1 Tax=Natronocella acetinitrilica TaxID=414046 RepID=A0AAE3G1S2_9GAMM|nr:flagellar brake protein [Natronocella acetinitrilica]MCP1673136.1 c-di-GMP-binding flagellar brake protein YcgR [Natronocella acetinitrilica]